MEKRLENIRKHVGLAFLIPFNNSFIKSRHTSSFWFILFVIYLDCMKGKICLINRFVHMRCWKLICSANYFVSGAPCDDCSTKQSRDSESTSGWKRLPCFSLVLSLKWKFCFELEILQLNHKIILVSQNGIHSNELSKNIFLVGIFLN